MHSLVSTPEQTAPPRLCGVRCAHAVAIILIAVILCSSLRALAAEPPSSSVSSGSQEAPLPELTEKQRKFVSFIGGEILPNGDIAIGDIVIHRREHEVSFPALINLADGDLEVAICTSPKGGAGKAHESLLITPVDPFKLQLSLILLGLENGARSGTKSIQKGDVVSIEMESFYCPVIYTRKFGVEELISSLAFTNKAFPRRPIEQAILDCQSGVVFTQVEWVFVGSSFGSNGFCEAAIEGTLIDINSSYQATSSIICPSDECGALSGSFRVKPGSVPPAGTLVTVHIFKKSK